MLRLSEKILVILGESVVEYWFNKTNQKVFSYKSLESIKTKLITDKNDNRNFVNATHYLSKRKYILFSGKGSKKKVVLTAKGGMQYLKYCSLVGENKFNGSKKSIVVLDVPEERRGIRDFLRRRLIENNYQLIGSSVYISNYSISKNLIFLIQFLNLEDFVTLGKFLPQEDR